MKRALSACVCLVILAVALPAMAELCAKCKGKMYIMNIGKCVGCGGATTSGAHKLCPACSRKLGQCEHCRAKVAGGAKPVQPVEPAAVLRLSKESHGKAFAASVGQTIVVRLRGNATTGFRWGAGKLTAGVVRPVSTKYAGAPAGVIGGGGEFVLTFKVVKAGTEKLTLEYKRPWEKKPPARTVAVTINAGADATAERARRLKVAVDWFTLDLWYLGDQDKPFYNLTLRVPKIKGRRSPFSPAVQLTKKEALAIIDHLAKDGYLRRAGNQSLKDLKAPAGPTYGLFVRGPRGLELYEFLGWDLGMLRRLDALRKVLDGDAAKKMDLLLGRLSGYKKAWEAAPE